MGCVGTGVGGSAETVLVKPAADGEPTVVYWHGARLGFAERHVDGWHAYAHPFLDPARARHCGNRACDTIPAAVDAITAAVQDAGQPITLIASGLRCDASWWDHTGDQHHRTVELRPRATGTWIATVATGATGIVSLSTELHGLLEVRVGEPDRFCGYATNLYDAACLLVADRDDG